MGKTRLLGKIWKLGEIWTLGKITGSILCQKRYKIKNGYFQKKSWGGPHVEKKNDAYSELRSGKRCKFRVATRYIHFQFLYYFATYWLCGEYCPWLGLDVFPRLPRGMHKPLLWSKRYTSIQNLLITRCYIHF